LIDHTCVIPPAFWPYVHATTVTLSNLTVSDNVSNCSLCSGGGVHLQSGGAVSVQDAVVWANSASMFGGGLSLGTMGGLVTCSVSMLGSCTVGNNSAGHGGAQLYNLCAGDVVFKGTKVQLGNGGTQASAAHCCW
jgi:hypothetical protein